MEMAERGNGSIVAVASIGARRPLRKIPGYSASKAGLVMALRVLGTEVAGRGVRINTVSPGPVDSHRLNNKQHYVGGDLANSRTAIQDGRVADPDDIARAIVFLLGPGADHILMQDVVVDGGELLGM
jgi:NAD(P)-dependent dehydrogenase (short-subunit alcohol dehydrogenase family)